MYEKSTRKRFLTVRIDDGLYDELKQAADGSGLTMSALVYSHLKQLMKDGESTVRFSVSEQQRRQQLARDFLDSIDWSTIDYMP